jgi:hypothetical protein
MPASLAVRAHWSVSQSAALKNATSLTPGVHSWPENVLNDQQMNMPQRSPLSSAARFRISTDSAHPAQSIANTGSKTIAVRVRFIPAAAVAL